MISIIILSYLLDFIKTQVNDGLLIEEMKKTTLLFTKELQKQKRKRVELLFSS